jgi:hypothetical protein
MAQKPANTAQEEKEEELDALDSAAATPQEGTQNLPSTTSGFVPGQLDMEDDLVLTPSEFPILKVASDMGKMKKDFENGELGFVNPEVLKLADAGGEAIDVLIVYLRAYLKENRKYVPNDPVPYKEYNTRQEASAAGETLDWTNVQHGDDIPPTVREASTFVLLTPLPEGEMTTAPVVHLFGKPWIPVRFYGDRSHYAKTAKPVIRATRMQLKDVGGFTAALWEMFSLPSDSKDYDNYVANIRLKRLLTDEEKEEFHSVLSQFGEVRSA